MGLLLDLDDDVACLHVWMLVGLSMENVAFPVWRALVDLYLNDLPLFGGLLAHALLASILLIDDLALAAAVVARARSL